MKMIGTKKVLVTPYDWYIPTYGNKHSMPYGWVKVNGVLEDGTRINGVFKTHGDLNTDHFTYQYIIINKQRYILRNTGSLYNPKFEIEKWNKEKIGKRWMYVKH